MSIKRINTLCVHGGKDNNNSTGAITVPVYQSATFAHPGVGQTTGYDYSRLQNPTREVLEKTIALLENGTDAMAFSSGMAAMAVLCELFSPGDHIIVTNDLYGGSVRFLNNVVKKNGVAVGYLDTGDIESLKKRILQTPRQSWLKLLQIHDAANRYCSCIGCLRKRISCLLWTIHS